MNTFYESGYVPQTREDLLPTKSKQLAKTIVMLSKHYNNVVVLVPTIAYINGSFSDKRFTTVLDELRELGISYGYKRTTGELIINRAWSSATFRFYTFDYGDKLRGPNHDAAIVVGKPKEELLCLLRMCLRIGDNPITVHI